MKVKTLVFIAGVSLATMGVAQAEDQLEGSTLESSKVLTSTQEGSVPSVLTQSLLDSNELVLMTNDEMDGVQGALFDNWRVRGGHWSFCVNSRC